MDFFSVQIYKINCKKLAKGGNVRIKLFFFYTIILAYTNVTYMLNTIQKKVRLHNNEKINCSLYLAPFVNKLTHFFKPRYTSRTSDDVFVVSFFIIISNHFTPYFLKHFISSILLLDRATDSVIVSLCSYSFHSKEDK